MKKFLVLILLLAVAVVATILLYIRLSEPPGPSNSTAVVRLKWLHQAQFIGFYAADQLGFYEDAGIDVELLPGGVDQPAVFQVVTGSADFGVTGADQILLARQEGHDVVAIAVIYRQTPFTLFSKDRPQYQSLADFRGTRVGVKYGGNEEITYRAMLAAAGLDAADFSEVGVKYDMTPFFADEVALWPGYRINEPLSAEERGIAVRLFNPEDVGVEMYADVLFAHNRLLDEQPELVRRFVDATLRGWREALDDGEGSAPFVRAYNPDADLAHELAMIRASAPLVQFGDEPIGLMSAAGWKNVADALELGDLSFASTELEAAFTNDFITPEPGTPE